MYVDWDSVPYGPKSVEPWDTCDVISPSGRVSQRTKFLSSSVLPNAALKKGGAPWVVFLLISQELGLLDKELGAVWIKSA